MIVRAATVDDVPRIVEMASRFYAQTHYAQIVPLADESAAGLALLLIEQGVVLVAEHEGEAVGMVALFLEPFLFNVSRMVATELAWWVDPEARTTGAGQALLEAIEPACRERGVHLVRMMTLEGSPAHAAALYARRGYSPTEHAYTKVL